MCVCMYVRYDCISMSVLYFHAGGSSFAVLCVVVVLCVLFVPLSAGVCLCFVCY
eukprot:m.6291 g.6291  ORF g.6291 m.6291 type:complete len:54 (+) comp5057_c0_seq2:3-164(+)